MQESGHSSCGRGALVTAGFKVMFQGRMFHLFVAWAAVKPWFLVAVPPFFWTLYEFNFVLFHFVIEVFLYEIGAPVAFGTLPGCIQ